MNQRFGWTLISG